MNLTILRNSIFFLPFIRVKNVIICHKVMTIHLHSKNQRMQIKMDEMTAPKREPNYLDRPLVSGCGIGYKLCLLHVSS